MANNRRASNPQQQQMQQQQQPLTFPILPMKELIDLLRDGLNVNLSPMEAQAPTAATVARVSSALLELITDVPRGEVGVAINAALSTAEYPELFREALPQLVLYHEMEKLSLASLYDVRLDDLIAPTAGRFQKFMSAAMNFGRFKEDVMRQHAEHTDALAALEEEIAATASRAGELTNLIRIAKERQAKEAPERAQLEIEIAQEELALRTLESERARLEQGVEEDKKRAEAVRRRCDAIAFDAMTLNNEAEELKSQLVSSPERIQSELNDQKRRLAIETEEVERQEEEERALGVKGENVRAANRIMDVALALLGEAEEQAAKLRHAEEVERERKTAIESHGYLVRELEQREQEAAREIDLAEEKNKRLLAQRAHKVELAKNELKQTLREREARERDREDGARRAQRLKQEAAQLKIQLGKMRGEHQEAMDARGTLFAEVLASFDAFVRSVDEGVARVKQANSNISQRLAARAQGGGELGGRTSQTTAALIAQFPLEATTTTTS